MRSLADSPPAAIVVDLSRSPSQGRDVALALRTRAGTRRVPLVVAGGKSDAVKGLCAHLPDAVLHVLALHRAATLERAIAEPPA